MFIKCKIHFRKALVTNTSDCLTLKPACIGCGSQSDLYGSSCRHMTLCFKCGKTMGENKAKCLDCGTIVTKLIREYNVAPSFEAGTDKGYDDWELVEINEADGIDAHQERKYLPAPPKLAPSDDDAEKSSIVMTENLRCLLVFTIDSLLKKVCKQDSECSVKEEKTTSVLINNIPTESVKAEPTSAPADTELVTEDELRAVLMENKQLTTFDLVSMFRTRLGTRERKNAFADIMKRITKIQRNSGSPNFVVLREQ